MESKIRMLLEGSFRSNGREEIDFVPFVRVTPKKTAKLKHKTSSVTFLDYGFNINPIVPTDNI